MKKLRWVAALVACIMLCSIPGPAYSVLTHEQIVDLVWQDQLRPMLLLRFPQATPDEVKHAHAFAYGGSLVQDMGYYPFGKKYFSDLLHYVRTGDFVQALLQESTDINEYAFALGALAHYSSDSYHDFIGFEVAQPLLERAFLKSYGLKLSDVLGDEDRAIGSFRRAVSAFIPKLTKAALLNRRADIVRDTPNFDRRKFLYHLSRANYEKEWGKGYNRPSFGVRVLAFFLRAVPKVGWASALAFKIPSTQTEDMYIKSVNRTVDNYQTLLKEQQKGDLILPDTDCDTGRATSGAEYSLADSTYARLLDDLSTNNFPQLTPELQANILEFYSNLNAPFHTKKNRKSWASTEAEIQKLKSWQQAQPVGTPAATKNSDSGQTTPQP